MLKVLGQGALDDESGLLHLKFSISTAGIDAAPGGLELKPQEEFFLAVGPTDEHPPTAYVEHYRFLGHPHVLSGFLLCLYLDESREWDPDQGLNSGPNGVLNRLWRWLCKASANEFDADKALYHAIGGLPQISTTGYPLPPIIVRDFATQRHRVGSMWLTRRTDWCLQLHSQRPASTDAEHVPVLFVDGDLPFGAGKNYLFELTARLDLRQRAQTAKKFKVGAALASVSDGSQRCNYSGPVKFVNYTVSHSTFEYPSHARSQHLEEIPESLVMLTALAASAARKSAGTPQVLVIAVPHPRGGPRHLIAVYFDSRLADGLRRLMNERTQAAIQIDVDDLNHKIPLQWCFISDERKEVNVRRDVSRPVTHLENKEILIWGVGGLGSWIAEFVTRAGAAKVLVCDTGRVTGGLLVRQNYVDMDVGDAKINRLVARLRAIAPSCEVEGRVTFDDSELEALLGRADLVIDATINRAVSRRLDALGQSDNRRAVVAQVATDAATGSLGLAIVHGPKSPVGLRETDRLVGRQILSDPHLERYRVFWSDPEPTDEFVPTRGCSLPTFHGSAADLAGVAASLASLIAPHLADGESGTHLFGLPHSGARPLYHYTTV